MRYECVLVYIVEDTKVYWYIIKKIRMFNGIILCCDSYDLTQSQYNMLFISNVVS